MKRLVILLLILAACAPVGKPVQQPVGLVIPEDMVDERAIPVPVFEEIREKCIDTDEGVNLFIKGVAQTADDSKSDTCLHLLVNGVKVPMNQVLEYSCEGGTIAADAIDCEHGCKMGACLTQPEPELPKHYLVNNGDCVQQVFDGAIKVTECYNDCLRGTRCEPGEYKSKSVSLPYQLNCLVRDNKWVLEKWVEFEVLRPVEVAFTTDISASEFVGVQVVDSSGNPVANPIPQREVARNKCFQVVKGGDVARLQPGKYEVHIGARATSPDMFRSFRGKDFAVQILRKL